MAFVVIVSITVKVASCYFGWCWCPYGCRRATTTMCAFWPVRWWNALLLRWQQEALVVGCGCVIMAAVIVVSISVD